MFESRMTHLDFNNLKYGQTFTSLKQSDNMNRINSKIVENIYNDNKNILFTFF